MNIFCNLFATRLSSQRAVLGLATQAMMYPRNYTLRIERFTVVKYFFVCQYIYRSILNQCRRTSCVKKITTNTETAAARRYLITYAILPVYLCCTRLQFLLTFLNSTQLICGNCTCKNVTYTLFPTYSILSKKNDTDNDFL